MQAFSVSVGALARLKCLLLGVVMFLSACSSQVVLFSSLSEADGNEIYAVLLDSGIPADKVILKDGVTIKVPDRLSAEALSILSARGLPKNRRGSIGEIFKKDGMISSPLEEKARYLYALSQELEQTLMTMDGVISARVHIVLPERTAPGQSLTPSSVAVFVKHKEDSPFPAYLSQIRDLVTSSIPNIPGEDPNQNVKIVAIPSAAPVETSMNLIWYGPMALKAEDRVYFIVLTYLLIGLWLLSLAAVYLSVSEESVTKKLAAFIKSRAGEQA